MVHDELDIDPYTLRLKMGGGEGGHNGLRSISACFGTKEYKRLRFGIGKPGDVIPGPKDVTAWVLGNFPKADEALLDSATDKAVQILEGILKDGFKQTQNIFNGN